MIYNMKIKTALLLSFLVLLAGCADKYVPFKMVKYDPIDGKYITIETHFSQDYIDNMLSVLEAFGQKYFMINGKLYITKELWEDKKIFLLYCMLADTEETNSITENKRTKRTRWAMKNKDTNILKRFRYRP